MAEVESNHEIQKVDQGAQAIELWKHFAGTGASDKNTMVTVASWLLAFSATIIGYIVTQLFESNSFALIQPWKALSLAALGAVISFVAGCVVLLYAGYANRNWARADAIASECGWGKLLPDNSKGAEEPDGKTFGLPRFAVGWSKDCNPHYQLPLAEPSGRPQLLAESTLVISSIRKSLPGNGFAQKVTGRFEADR